LASPEGIRVAEMGDMKRIRAVVGSPLRLMSGPTKYVLSRMRAPGALRTGTIVAGVALSSSSYVKLSGKELLVSRCCWPTIKSEVFLTIMRRRPGRVSIRKMYNPFLAEHTAGDGKVQ